MSLELCPAYDQQEAIAKLFSEYTAMLLATDPTVADCLQYQNYDDELERLDQQYGEPDGRLYLARLGGHVAGCIGLHRVDDARCEMKRLYVRPAFRGNRIAGRLVEAIIADAREIGYRAMVLDTLPFLIDAIRLYQRFGFYEIPAYNENPFPEAVYMQLDL